MRSIRERADAAQARATAAHAERLAAIEDLASTGAWRGDGATDLASWLAARWQIALRSARELVRDAEALKDRPALKEALTSGAISADQSKALAVLCVERTDDDERWLEALPFWSYPELEREARKKTARELERRDGGTYLRMSHTSDERFMRGEFQLHPEDGAALLSTIDARVPRGTPLRDWDQASALALVELAKGPGTGSSPRTTVLLSVSEELLSGKPNVNAVATLGTNDGFVGAETARRLTCDARTQVLYRDEANGVTGMDKTSRNISPALRRAIEERDRGRCTFPACERDAYLDCHHIVHVAHGGPTVPSNLVLTCWTHHQLIHEGGWSLGGVAGPHITWLRPDGAPFEPRVRVTLDTS